MKTVNNIIWSDLFDDEVSSWESSEVYSAEYFPITNSLDIFLNYYSKEAIDHDPT